MVGGCKTECQKPDGALFCSDQYIDHGGNLRQCVDSLNALLSAKVQISSSTELYSDCQDGVCSITIGAEGGIGCGEIAHRPNASVLPLGLFLLALLGIVLRRRA
jgi:hypothetical protein